MTIRHIQQWFEDWAPKKLAWERDNVGLLIGDSDTPVRRILVCLDVTDEVVDEARSKRADLIVSHHPLLFHPLKSVSESDRVGRLVHKLIRHRIAVYAAHTNLDFTRSGVSMALAGLLGLREPTVLQKNAGMYDKLVVFVPETHADRVMNAMASAGAGAIGKYEQCSFQVEGIGTFQPGAGAQPFVGKAGKLERAPEIRLEMILPQWRVQQVLASMRATHPYEEIAYDLYALENRSQEYGAGAIGELETETTLKAFLKTVRSSLHTGGMRYAGSLNRRIKRVAVCGGRGPDLLEAAVSEGAEVFITADVPYHTFQSADGRIALIDAGHFETEQPIVQKIVQYLQDRSSDLPGKLTIAASRRSRNPVQYYPS